MNTKKITTISMLTALALIIFIIEAQIPPLVAVPGIKLGLANVVTMVTFAWFGRKDAFAVLMLRIVLSSVFSGSLMSFVYSLSGGILCFIVMSLSLEIFKNSAVWVISVLGAISHNIGQIIAAIFFTSTWQIAAYLPVLLISAVITGLFTGITAQAIIKRNKLVFGGDKT